MRGSFSTLWFSDCVALCHPDEIFRKPKVGSKHLNPESKFIKPTTPLHRGLQPFPTVPCVRFEPKAGSAASAQLTVSSNRWRAHSSPCHPTRRLDDPCSRKRRCHAKCGACCGRGGGCVGGWQDATGESGGFNGKLTLSWNCVWVVHILPSLMFYALLN